jgi:hypothetical protein
MGQRRDEITPNLMERMTLWFWLRGGHHARTQRHLPR